MLVVRVGHDACFVADGESVPVLPAVETSSSGNPEARRSGQTWLERMRLMFASASGDAGWVDRNQLRNARTSQATVCHGCGAAPNRVQSTIMCVWKLLPAIAAATLGTASCAPAGTTTSTVSITMENACKYAFDKATAPERFVSDCDQVCPDNGYCTLDPDYVQLYEMANGFDALIATDAGPTGTCPQWPSAQVTVTCHTYG